jgi:hypothetical protein
MNTTAYASLFMAAIVSVPVSNALADSTDEALNQFYSENAMSHLGSDFPGATVESPSPAQKEESRAKGSKTRKGSVNTDASRQSSLFGYRSSAAVKNKAQINFLSALSANNPTNRSVFQKELATNPAGRFDSRFSQYGYSPHNLADSFAGLVIILWEISNNQDASTHPAGIRQVRAKVSELLAPKTAITSLPNASKQYLSEYVKLLAAIYYDVWKHQRSTNNAAGIQNVQNMAYQTSLKLGVDFKKLRLTDTGFQNI